jgi:arylsulfatase A-like enzyme
MFSTGTSDRALRQFTSIAILAVVYAAFGNDALKVAHCNDAIMARKPNIVFILVDDLGWRDLGCFGSTFYETPNVDQLAKSGLRFTSAYAACPVCSPTRASILTGNYPTRTGITDYINAAGGNQPEQWTRPTKMLPARYSDRLAHSETTIAEALKSNGYKTFFAGKWHLGPEDYWPEDQGFDVNKGGITRGGPYGGNKYFSPYGNERLTDGPPGEHLPDRLASEAVQFIEQNKDNPFLLYLSFYSVHTPLMAPEDLKAKYQQKKASIANNEPVWGSEGNRKVRLIQDHAVYAGMVEAMDQAVGKVLDALDKNSVSDNTIVIFTSDNGGLSTSEGHPTSNLPIRAGKGWLYEGGIRVPTIIRWPGVTQPNSNTDQYLTSTDYYPTMLEMAGIAAMPTQHPDGISIVELLKGNSIKRGPVYWHYPHYGNQGGSPGGAVRDGRYKLIQWYEDDRIELFDLQSDLAETKNLADIHPDKAKQMMTKLSDWRSDTGAVMPTQKEN